MLKCRWCNYTTEELRVNSYGEPVDGWRSLYNHVAHKHYAACVRELQESDDPDAELFKEKLTLMKIFPDVPHD